MISYEFCLEISLILIRTFLDLGHYYYSLHFAIRILTQNAK